MNDSHSSSLRLVGILAAFITAGCTTLGPDFSTPDAPLAEGWSEPELGAGATQDTPSDSSAWWTQLGDPVLDDVIERAYVGNYSLQAVGLRILAARAQLGIAVGQQYPQTQQIRGSVNRIRNDNENPNLDENFTRGDIGFDVAWEIDFWGRARRGVESASANYGSTVADYQNALVSLTGEVARVYVTIRTLEERVEIARQNVAQQERSFRIATVRYESGAVTELDPTQAKTLLRQTEATVYQLEIQLRQAKNALATLLGLPPQDMSALLTGSIGIPTPPDSINAGVPADMLRRRPDIRSAELRAAAQSAQVGVAVTDLFPRFTLLGSLGYLTNSAVDSDSGQLDGGFGLVWPVFNYGRLRNNVRLQDARLEESLVLYRDTVLQAAREVEDGIVAFRGNQGQARLLADGVAAAQRAVALSLIQYRDGAVDYQRVLDSQSRLAAVQDTHIAARGDVVLSLVATYKALGGGWQIRAGDDVVPTEMQQRMQERTDWGDLLPALVRQDLPEAPPTGNDQPVLSKPDW